MKNRPNAVEGDSNPRALSFTYLCASVPQECDNVRPIDVRPDRILKYQRQCFLYSPLPILLFIIPQVPTTA